MELQATIDKRKGKPNYNDVSNILDYLFSQGAHSSDPAQNLLRTNHIRVGVLNLTDPQSFYQYLSQNGYTLRESVLIQDCRLKQEGEN